MPRRLAVLLLCAGLLVLPACSSLRAPSAGHVEGPGDPVAGDEQAQPAAAPAQPQGSPEWLLAPFRQALAVQINVDALLDRDLNVLRLAYDPERPPADLAWLALDRANGLALLWELAAGDLEDPGQTAPGGLAYEVTYRVEPPITGVSFDEHARQLLLTVHEASGSDLWEQWFRVLQPVDGRFREVWRGPADVSVAKGSDYVVRRRGSLAPDPAGAGSLVYSHETQLLFRPAGAEPQTLRAEHVTDLYRRDDRERRFVPAGDAAGAGRYLVLESAITVPFGAVNVFVADTARTHLAPEAVLRLVDRDGQAAAVMAPVEAGTHVWLEIPARLAPGEYRIELAPAPDREALDSVPLLVLNIDR